MTENTVTEGAKAPSTLIYRIRKSKPSKWQHPYWILSIKDSVTGRLVLHATRDRYYAGDREVMVTRSYHDSLKAAQSRIPKGAVREKSKKYPKYIDPIDSLLPKSVNRKQLGWKFLDLVLPKSGKHYTPRQHKTQVKRLQIASAYRKNASGDKAFHPRPEQIWKIGKWYLAPGVGNIVCCHRGFHCSPSIQAAGAYVKEGLVLARVEYRGQVDSMPTSGDQQAKKASSEMRILKAWMVTPEFRLATKFSWSYRSSGGSRQVKITPNRELVQMVTQLVPLGKK